MVRRLHAAGIEVILDVVFNHTARATNSAPRSRCGGWTTPATTDCAATIGRFTRTTPAAATRSTCVIPVSRSWCWTACASGPARWGRRLPLRPGHGAGPRRAWVHDPGAVLHRAGAGSAAFASEDDRRTLDIGPGGYQLGGFPHGWLEWNDRFRDTLRRFWVSGHASRGDFALRLCGSSDVYQPRRRGPEASINYVVSHDGFTLHDLVSHAHRHNDANGENNRDGHGDNHSANSASKGRPTTWRSRQRATASSAHCWPAHCSPRAHRCWPPATSWGTARTATTTPIARTTPPPGSTGRAPMLSC